MQAGTRDALSCMDRHQPTGPQGVYIYLDPQSIWTPILIWTPSLPGLLMTSDISVNTV